jgi:FAD/FMN-containing dehydrogenase
VVLDGIDLAEAAIEAFLARGDGGGGDPELLPSGGLQSYRGAIAAVGDTAFGHRDALVEFVAVAGWTDPAQDQARMAAARRYGAAVEPFASGVYVNDLTDESQAGIHRAYGPSVLARLAALKDRYDPDNVLHLNHNIRPTARRAQSLGAQPTLPGRRNT